MSEEKNSQNARPAAGTLRKRAILDNNDKTETL